MGVIPSRALKYSFDSLPMECNAKTLTRTFTNETIESDAFCQVSPITHVGNYKWGTDWGGDDDFDDGGVDDILFQQVGNDTGAATDLDPTGASVAADHPHYVGQEKLASYTITAGLNAMVSYSAKTMGAGAVSRNVS